MVDVVCGYDSEVNLTRITWPAARDVGQGRFLVHGAEAAVFFKAPAHGLLVWGDGDPLPFDAKEMGDGVVLPGPAVVEGSAELADIGSLALFIRINNNKYEGRVLHRDEEIDVVCERSGMGPVRTSWWMRVPQ